MVVEGLDKVYLYEEMFCIGVQTFVSKPSEGCSLCPEPGPVRVNAKRVEDPVICILWPLTKGSIIKGPLTRVCILPSKWSFVVFFYTVEIVSLKFHFQAQPINLVPPCRSIATPNHNPRTCKFLVHAPHRIITIESHSIAPSVSISSVETTMSECQLHPLGHQLADQGQILEQIERKLEEL